MRWRLADDAGGQGALFDGDDLVERHIGTGEFRGLEFLHVNAKRIISEVPAQSRMPFRHTINAYRGCSHACTYCLGPDTLILMADGRVRRIPEVQVGDRIVGTSFDGRYRRYVETTVLDHWSSVKRAWRVSLGDGTELIASGDHRFLTSAGGWKHVTDDPVPGRQRPHLTTNDELLGFGAVPDAPKHDDDDRRRYLSGVIRGDGNVASNADLRVLSIQDLGFEIRMYDITTGTGDFIANGVVSHNCFARPTHAYLDLDTGVGFDSQIVVKVNAVERLRADLRGKRWSGEHIAMGTNTDPYQRAEGKYHLTRGIVETLGMARNPFAILTKSSLIVRDIDVLTEAAARTDVSVSFSIGTLDPDVWKATEPGAPHPRQRLHAIRRLVDAGIPCGVLMAPILPGISDSDEQLRAVVDGCVDAGVSSISTIGLHLRKGVREVFMARLATTHPHLLAEYERRYAGRAYLPQAYNRDLSVRVRQLVGDRLRPRPQNSLRWYSRQDPTVTVAVPPDQLSLAL